MTVVDSVSASIPQPVPSQDELAQSKLIYHRGAHDNCDKLENTLHALTQPNAA